MKLSITYKLLSSFFIATVVVVATMLFLMQWSFERGFLEYVNTMEQEAHANLEDALEEYYDEYGTWDGLRGDWRRWVEMQILSFMKTEAAREQFTEFQRRTPIERGLNERDIDPGVKPLNPQDTEHIRRRRRRDRGFDPSFMGPAGMFGNEARMRIDPRIALLDKDKNLVVGNFRNKTDREFKEIEMDNKVIGYLALVPRNQMFDNTELQFTQEQGRTFSLIALAIVIISSIIILPLSRSLVKPIKRVANATRELASGKYAIRIPVGPNDEIGRLARDFNSLANTLEKNEVARRQWIADISHELRTPLSILRGEIEAIQDGVREISPQRLDALHLQIMNLNRLIGDLYELSLSDIGAMNYQKSIVKLVPILEGSISGIRDDFESKKISLLVDYLGLENLSLFADQDRLNQLFTNLLVNTIRYTDEGGELKINLHKNQSDLVIDFIDTIPGIPDTEIDKLFDRLYRIDTSRSRETGGAGLGLSICKNIVEAHGGSIKAYPSPEGGLWISVTFPIEG